MSLKDTIAADVANVFLNADEFADDDITRYAGGDTGSSTTVTAIFEELEKPVRDTSRGREVVRTGTLHVDGDQDVTDSDTWLINSELWQTTAIRGIEHGMRQLTLQRNDIETLDVRGHKLK